MKPDEKGLTLVNHIAGPLVAYALAFAYERGFAGVFGIPEGAIEVSLAQVFTAASVLFGGALGAVLLGDVILSLLPPLEGALRASVARLVALLLGFIVAYIIPYRFLWREWIGAVYVLTMFVFLELLLPLVTQRSHKTYQDKLGAQEKLDLRQSKLSGSLQEILGVWNTAVIVGVLIALVASYNYGRARAMTQETYLVTDSPAEMVVLRVYEGRLVCAPLDRKAKAVDRAFMFLDLMDATNKVFRLEDVGPLQPKGERH